MEKKYEGSLIGTELKVAIVVASFNHFITSKLLDGATNTLKMHDVNENHIDVVWVPGAFEIPLIAQKLAVEKEYDAIITLGVVIRGSTSHFDYVCNEVAKGVSHAALISGKPVVFGVLTTDTIEQAIERAGTTSGNKGADAAVTAIEMANLVKDINK